MKIRHVGNRASSCRRGAALFAVVLAAVLCALSAVKPNVGRLFNPLAATLLARDGTLGNAPERAVASRPLDDTQVSPR